MEKQYDQAIDLYTNILKKYPENRLARLQLARVLSWQGRFEEARVEYRKILGEAK
jgi:tetratricopeptide (TPR) repeat protein